MSDLTGKRALVTGGSRGIGAAIARRLAAAGADVAVSYEQAADKAMLVADEITAGGRRGIAIQADSADADAVARLVDDAAAGLGGLDILVNNAGIWSYGMFDDVSVELFDRMMAIHARAPFVAAQSAVKHMTDGGRIITIGSYFADRVHMPGIVPYAASKSALLGLTKGLARDLGDRGITVNLVQPGPTDTDMNPADGPSSDSQRARTVLGRYANADEIATLVAHLTGEGGRAVTGAVFTIDAGANS